MEPDLKVVGTPLVVGVNLPRIDIPTFDGKILNWRGYSGNKSRPPFMTNRILGRLTN